MRFWDTVQEAIKRAADDAKFLDCEQELVLWHTVENTYKKGKLYYIGHLRAKWLRQIAMIIAEERNFP